MKKTDSKVLEAKGYVERARFCIPYEDSGQKTKCAQLLDSAIGLLNEVLNMDEEERHFHKTEVAL